MAKTIPLKLAKYKILLTQIVIYVFTVYILLVATECRTLVHYTFPVAFKNRVPKEIYDNIMILHVSLTILSNPDIVEDMLDDAREFIIGFIEHCIEIYGGISVCSYNLHALSHLCDDVELYGVLTNFDAFDFENKLQWFKKICRKPGQTLAQIVRREIEKDSMPVQPEPEKKLKLMHRHIDGPLPHRNMVCQQYSKLITAENMTLSKECSDSTIRWNGQIYSIQNIICLPNENVQLICKKFREKEDFYTYPLESSKLGIYQVRGLNDQVVTIPLENVEKKYFKLPYGDSFAVFPIMHT